MSEQQSQKSGSRSEAQKLDRARAGYDPMAPANEVAGAFGGERDTPADRDTPTDRDTALDHLAGNGHEKGVRNDDD